MRCFECKCMHVGWDKNSPTDAWCTGVKHPFKIKDVKAECTEYLDNESNTGASCGDLGLKADSYTKPKFIMLTGIPGSGKSTHAKHICEADYNTVWLSSDNIREKLYGDANCQKDPAKVFEIMQKETLELLDKGFNVIYDATNINRKNRCNILDKLPKHVHKKCVIIWAPIDICIERDKARERTVGEAVIDKMLRRFEAPFYDEGFNEINVHISNVHYNEKQYYLDLIAAMNIAHDNPHHTLSVLDHCYECGTALLDTTVDSIVVKAGFLHDIGKPYTKTYKNRKGEDETIAHYYDHQAVGAYLSYGISGHNPTLAWLISTHMAPFINQKYYNSLPACYKRWIDLLHIADKAAH